jgi:hypothetical protein
MKVLRMARVPEKQPHAQHYHHEPVDATDNRFVLPERRFEGVRTLE